MTLGEGVQIATAAVLLIAVIAAVVIERRRRRRFLSTLYHETRGLCGEAADLAEAICARQADGRAFDQAFMDRYTLSEPQTYCGLVPDLWRLRADLSVRAIEFHGHLAIARARWAAWRSGGQGQVNTYLLISALTRSVNAVEPLRRYIEHRQRRPQSRSLRMPLASVVIEQVERANPEYLDRGYWSE